MHFFTADIHAGHSNILKYCNRPFNDTFHMDRVLIDNWNSVVAPNDTIYVLGDFCFSRYNKEIFNKLNGNKHLIVGNHDKREVKQLPWGSVSHLLEVDVDGQHIVLCHYAMRVWNKSFHGAWHLYGHSHSTLLEDSALSFDIGVDGWGYKPVSFNQVKAKMDWKKQNKQFFIDLRNKYGSEETLDDTVRKSIVSEMKGLNSKWI